MNARPFVTEVVVRFADCDPAGIVFYPRYFEMFNAVVEDWCEREWGIGFRELIMERGLGLPTVHVETDFIAPSRLGDRLRAELAVRKIGGTSIAIAIRLTDEHGADRVRSNQVLVLMDRTTGRSIPLLPEWRERIAAFMASESTGNQTRKASS